MGALYGMTPHVKGGNFLDPLNIMGNKYTDPFGIMNATAGQHVRDIDRAFGITPQGKADAAWKANSLIRDTTYTKIVGSTGESSTGAGLLAAPTAPTTGPMSRSGAKTLLGG